MALPEPVPGLVIRYSYLWRREHLQGLEEGQKDRPSAIVAAIRTEGGAKRVLVLPITHGAASSDTVAIEIPAVVLAWALTNCAPGSWSRSTTNSSGRDPT